MTDGETLSGGHYRLGSSLTGDGAGRVAVRAARDEWGDRDVVAVALAPDGLAPDGDGPPAPDALTRVARDIRRLAAASHPGLAPADDVAAGADRRLWLVHDLPAGVRGLADDGPVAPAVALRRAVVLAGALGAAHAARVVHGRVGADVVLVGGDDAVWLLGAPSGVRPSDRPGAEDDDTRALAATLLGAGTDGSEPELAARLAAVLERAAHATPDVPGDLGATLRRELGELGGPEEAPPVRLTEVIPTATAAGAWSPTRPVAVEPPTGPGPARERTTTPVLVSPHGRGPAAPVLPRPASGIPARRPVAVAPPRPSGPVPARPAGPGAAPQRPGPGGDASGPGRPPTRTGLVVLVVVVVVLLLAGAVAAVLVLGSDAAPAGPSDRVVPAAIGDPRTVDPCGLVDPAALAARTGGEARVVPDLGGPAACVVDVAAPGGDIAVIATLEPVATTVSRRAGGAGRGAAGPPGGAAGRVLHPHRGDHRGRPGRARRDRPRRLGCRPLRRGRHRDRLDAAGAPAGHDVAAPGDRGPADGPDLRRHLQPAHAGPTSARCRASTRPRSPPVWAAGRAGGAPARAASSTWVSNAAAPSRRPRTSPAGRPRSPRSSPRATSPSPSAPTPPRTGPRASSSSR